MRINTMPKWEEVSAKLKDRGYTLWQTQYSSDQPMGYHARFFCKGMPEVEIVTHNPEIEALIIKFSPGKY